MKTRIQILINTYNRPLLLNRLLSQIKEFTKDFNTKIAIANDGSGMPYDLDIEKNIPKNVMYYRFPDNNGKKEYYKVCNKLFSMAEPSDYYFMLPDDAQLNHNFFNRAIYYWDNIQDSSKICLTLSHHGGRYLKKCWTNFEPQIGEEVTLTQWNDLYFISQHRFFDVLGKIEPINKSRWYNNEYLSSGIGQQISQKLHRLGYAMYQTNEDLTHQYNNVSVMNPLHTRPDYGVQ